MLQVGLRLGAKWRIKKLSQVGRLHPLFWRSCSRFSAGAADSLAAYRRVLQPYFNNKNVQLKLARKLHPRAFDPAI
jgi:hypothetical protein